VLAELDEWTGKSHFVIVNGDGSMDLFYAVDSYTGFASSLAISDSAFNDTTILAPIIESPPLTEEGSEIYTGGTIIYGDANTRLSATRTTPESLHDYWHIAYWDSEARSAADATNRLAVMLDGAQAEELTYRCQIEVLIAQIDNIKCGQTISFRCAAAKVTSNTTLRIVRLTWKPPEHPEGPYLVDLELSVPSKTRKRRPPPGAAGTGSGTGGDGGHGDVPPTDPSPCDNCPPFVAPAPTLLHTYNLHYLDGTAIAGPSTLDGDFSGSWQISSGTQFWSPGGTSLVGYDLKHFGTTTAPPDPSGVHNHRREFLALVVGGTATHARLTGRIGNTGSIAPVNWTLEAGNWPIARPSAGGTPPAYGYIGSGIGGGTLTVASPFAAIDVTWPISGGMAQWVLKVTTDPTVAGDFSGVGIDDPTAPDTSWTLRTYQASTTVPVSGQFVGSDVPSGSVDGSNATFTASFPFMPGSLEKATVNSVDWLGDVASQNPSTGSFTLSHPPKAGLRRPAGLQGRLMPVDPSYSVRLGWHATDLDVDGHLPADQVPYDNTTSGLTATNAKAAIDEVAASTGGGGCSRDRRLPRGYGFRGAVRRDRRRHDSRRRARRDVGQPDGRRDALGLDARCDAGGSRGHRCDGALEPRRGHHERP
jgi:hypothetical protein